MLRKLLGSALLALALLAGTASVAAAAPNTGTLAARGYVDEGNLRRDPVQKPDNTIVRIYRQWVDINCWIDGGPNGFGSNRWFRATYYGQVGYLSSGVVSQQPSVGHC